MTLRLSIAMCTYNGARYVDEQLDSFVAQARRPDELIVCDDGSTDGTAERVRAFAGRAPFPVSLHVNEQTLGVVANFEQAVTRCTGDVILLSDQDDVWLAEKLQRFEQLLEARPEVGFVASNARIVDEQLRPLGYDHWEGLRFVGSYRRRVLAGDAFGSLLQLCIFSGAASAFRASYRNLVLPFPPGWLHDRWTAQLISGVAAVGLIEEPTILYRQHASQVAGGTRQDVLRSAVSHPRLEQQSFEDDIAVLSEMRRRLSRSDVRPRDGVMALLDAKLDFLRARAAMRARPGARFPKIAAQLLRGRYHRVGRGWLTVARDLLG